MLFLLRPRQTYMPYSMPRRATQQDEYRWQLREQAYASTRRVASYQPDAPDARAPAADPVAALKELAEMHRTGVLSDAEFSDAKARVLGAQGAPQ
jgi:hypothetical protein